MPFFLFIHFAFSVIAFGEIYPTYSSASTDSATSIATAATPAAAMQAQYSYAVGWWSRAAAQMLTLNSALLQGQADAIRPIHNTAVANAKRLKK